MLRKARTRDWELSEKKTVRETKLQPKEQFPRGSIKSPKTKTTAMDSKKIQAMMNFELL